nr:nuclear transport factor 2 family protein [Pseudomonas sp.]
MMALEEQLIIDIHPVLSQLTHQFFWHLDEFEYEQLVNLMEPDARWHRQGRVLAGHEDILSALRERSSTQKIRHVITNIQLTEASRHEAKVVAYMTAYKHDSGVETALPREIKAPGSFLLVRTHFRHDGSRWLVAEQAADREFVFV